MLRHDVDQACSDISLKQNSWPCFKNDVRRDDGWHGIAQQAHADNSKRFVEYPLSISKCWNIFTAIAWNWFNFSFVVLQRIKNEWTKCRAKHAEESLIPVMCREKKQMSWLFPCEHMQLFMIYYYSCFGICLHTIDLKPWFWIISMSRRCCPILNLLTCPNSTKGREGHWPHCGRLICG